MIEIASQIKTIEEILGEPYGKIPIIENNQSLGLFKDIFNGSLRKLMKHDDKRPFSSYNTSTHSIHFDFSGLDSAEGIEHHKIHELLHGYVNQRNSSFAYDVKHVIKKLFLGKYEEITAYKKKQLVLTCVDEGIANYIAIKYLKTKFPDSKYLETQERLFKNPVSNKNISISDRQSFVHLMNIIRKDDGKKDILLKYSAANFIGYSYVLSLCDGQKNIGPIINNVIRKPPKSLEQIEESVMSFYNKSK